MVTECQNTLRDAAIHQGATADAERGADALHGYIVEITSLDKSTWL